MKNKRPNPIIKIDRRHFKKFPQLVYQAASKSNGGKNTKKTISGSILITGAPGMREIPKPPITNKMG
ncbi:hypothetical protein D3C73_1539190 [compost metagenome]